MPLHGFCVSAALVAAPPPEAQALWQAEARLPVAAALEVRNAAGGVADSAESEHFVYWWGEDREPTAEEQAIVLDALEAAWADQIDGLGFAPPPGTSRYKVNVYEVASGITMNGGGIDLPGAGGWTGLDPDGWPYIGIPLRTWETDAASADAGYTPYGQMVAGMLGHEFQHASQMGAARWGGAEDLWFIEALAEWGAVRLVPGSIFIEQSLLGLVAVPHLALEWADLSWYAGTMPDALDVGDDVLGPGAEGLQFYQGWPLLWVVADRLGDEAVAAVAVDDGGHATPLSALDAVLDGDAHAAWAEAVGRVRTDDLPGVAWGAALFETSVVSPGWLDGYGDFLVPLQADGSWQQHPDPALLPQHLGLSRWRLDDPPDALWLRFEGDAVGSAGTPVAWQLVAVVLDEHGEGVSWRLPQDGATPWVVDLADAAALELFVVPGAETYVVDETFDYRLAAGSGGSGEPAGGCQAVPAGAAMIPMLLLLPALRRRRLTRSRDHSRWPHRCG